MIQTDLSDLLHRKVNGANYSLKYNVMPFVGLLKTGEAARTSEPVAFPLAQSRVS